MLGHKWCWSFVSGGLLLAFVSATATADIIYTSNGFEPAPSAPAFVPGSLEGQPGSVPGQEQWKKILDLGATSSASTATVQTTTALGQQAVQLSRGNGNALAADVRFARFVDVIPVSQTQPIISVDYDFLYKPGATNDLFGEFAGIDAFDEPDGGPQKRLGGGGVDVKTGEILYSADDPTTSDQGAALIFGTGLAISANEWHHFRIDYNFLLKSYSVFVDADTVAVVPATVFVDGDLNPTNFTDARIASLPGPDGLITPTGVAYFDNYVISSSVPEPVLFSGLVFGALGASRLGRRRR